MESVLQEKMKQSLLQIKEEIIQNLIAENEDFQAFIGDMDPKDMVDLATDDMGRSTLETLSKNDMRRLRLIDSALSRIKNGMYGKCLQCGKKIPEARLEAIPYAVKCIDCQTRDERLNR